MSRLFPQASTLLPLCVVVAMAALMRADASVMPLMSVIALISLSRTQ